MNQPHVPDDVGAAFLAQPNDVRGRSNSEKDKLIVSMRKLDGKLHIVSRYGDSAWWLVNIRKNTKKAESKIDFNTVPEAFREEAKAVVYRYMRRGTMLSPRPPAGATVARFFGKTRLFLKYLVRIGVSSLAEVTPLIFTSYVNYIKSLDSSKDTPRNKRASQRRITVVETLYELSQYTEAKIQNNPCPDTNDGQAEPSEKNRRKNRSRKTPLMPDDVFSLIFSKAWDIVTDAARLFGLRSNLQNVRAKNKNNPSKKYITMLKTPALKDAGFDGTLFDFKSKLKDVRTACYIVIASLSGCRVHELANMRTNGYHSTIEKDGERYWWIRSESNKTYEGATEWMVPEAAITAVRVLEQWAAPHQERIRKEIEDYRRDDAHDIRIAEAREHMESLFLGVDTKKRGLVRTLGTQAINNALEDFARECGLTWIPTTHQFRRKFANYVARSKFGDLRYLREHFKHWSMDMTLGYALNESQELALYLEIQDELDNIKIAVVDSWLDTSEPLAGGYGENLVAWRQRGENVILFKSHADMVRSIATSTPIRSNGHAWCTAGDNSTDCVGNDLDKTRCGAGCDQAVVGRAHTGIYLGLFEHLKEVETAKDIGPGGLARVKRDVKRCADVLTKLGCPPLEA